MPRPANAVPVYRRHTSTGQAICTVRTPGGARKDIYLGRWNSAASKAEYNRIVALVAAHGGVYPDAAPDLTVNEALVRYATFIDGYYRDADGTATTTLRNTKITLGDLKRLFGPTLLADFGPPELKAVRTTMIAEGRVRTQINKHVNAVRQFFRWCVEERLVGPDVLATLRAVAPLRPGRSGATEGEPRQPADPAAVEAALPHMPPAVRAIVQLLRLTGARPTEVLTLRPCDLDRSAEVWRYTPAQHKGTWRGKPRIIYLGPASKAVLAPWLLGVGPEEYVFSPKRSEEMRNRERAASRRVKLWPSHARRNERNRQHGNRRRPVLADRYDRCALARTLR